MYFVICELKIHASFLFAIKFKGKVTTNVIAVVETRRDGDNTFRPFEEILYLIGPYCVTKTLIKIANSKKKRLRAGGCLRCKFIQKKCPCFRFRSMLPAHVKITFNFYLPVQNGRSKQGDKNLSGNSWPRETWKHPFGLCLLYNSFNIQNHPPIDVPHAAHRRLKYPNRGMKTNRRDENKSGRKWRSSHYNTPFCSPMDSSTHNFNFKRAKRSNALVQLGLFIYQEEKETAVDF